jgi:membrane-associated phospholipid phosphatase
MTPILEWGIPVIAWLQGLGAWLTPFMQAFTFLGDEQFYLLILPILLWWVDIGLGIRIGLALLLSAGLNGGLKLVFGMPRPYWVSTKIQALNSGTTYGIPSGHAQNAVVLWGRLAVLVKSGWMRWVLWALIALIGISRSYLGVHFPTDVLIGWGIGLLLLWALVALDEPVRTRLARMSVGGRIGMVSLLTLAIIAFGAAPWVGPDRAASADRLDHRRRHLVRAGSRCGPPAGVGQVPPARPLACADCSLHRRGCRPARHLSWIERTFPRRAQRLRVCVTLCPLCCARIMGGLSCAAPVRLHAVGVMHRR